MPQVIATQQGYDNIAVREPGDRFEAPKTPAGKPILVASWYTVVDELEEATAVKQKQKQKADTGLV